MAKAGPIRGATKGDRQDGGDERATQDTARALKNRQFVLLRGREHRARTAEIEAVGLMSGVLSSALRKPPRH
jgi:hypothetical protein